MKIILEIIRYILAASLALVIGVIYICNIALSTVLSEGYIVSKLSQTNYYKKVYENFNENLSKYIMQSGLDESIINNVCNIEKVEQDTNYILENIYFGKSNDIDVEFIKNNLNNNINEFINGQDITVESRESIDQFVELICNEYKDTIMHTQYESSINGYIVKVQNYAKNVNDYGKFIIIGIIIFIFIIDIRRPSRNIAIAGISFMLLGIILIYGKNILLKNIDIQNIFIISEAFSDSLKLILEENLSSIIITAKRFIILGVVLIILGNCFQVETKKKNRNRKQLYLPAGRV